MVFRIERHKNHPNIIQELFVFFGTENQKGRLFLLDDTNFETWLTHRLQSLPK
jgi:hypothetical protein